jgi:hypothetical protein
MLGGERTNVGEIASVSFPLIETTKKEACLRFYLISTKTKKNLGEVVFVLIQEQILPFF